MLHEKPCEFTWSECWPVAGGMAWQEPHTSGPGGGVVVVPVVPDDDKAAAMALISVGVRVERDCIPGTVLMPVWINDAVAPR